ncbi:hypothetical protein BC831DRAFT_121177 [Entophlyctis helioformis]|nr:hypothetical protein BC831DRAFT_121177 [Entophlyctis helioformis]
MAEQPATIFFLSAWHARHMHRLTPASMVCRGAGCVGMVRVGGRAGVAPSSSDKTSRLVVCEMLDTARFEVWVSTGSAAGATPALTDATAAISATTGRAAGRRASLKTLLNARLMAAVFDFIAVRPTSTLADSRAMQNGGAASIWTKHRSLL